jgi:hypothetical protein
MDHIVKFEPDRQKQGMWCGFKSSECSYFEYLEHNDDGNHCMVLAVRQTWQLYGQALYNDYVNDWTATSLHFKYFFIQILEQFCGDKYVIFLIITKALDMPVQFLLHVSGHIHYYCYSKKNEMAQHEEL